MKTYLILLPVPFVLFSCKKSPQEPPVAQQPVSKAAYIAGKFPDSTKVENIIGLTVTDAGDLYICAGVTGGGKSKALFYTLPKNAVTWQRCGTHELSGSYVSDLFTDNAGNFYCIDDRLRRYSSGTWFEISGPSGYSGAGTGGMGLAVSASGTVYANMLNGSPPYDHSFLKYSGSGWSILGCPATDLRYGSGFYPRKMKCDNNNQLYVGTLSTRPNHFLYRHNSDTTWTRIGPANYRFLTSYGIEFDRYNNLYVVAYDTSSYSDTFRGDFIAKWTGLTWYKIPFPSDLAPNGFSNNYIYTLSTDKNGNLYAAGTLMNKSQQYIIARWDGTSWTQLGLSKSVFFNKEIYYLDADGQGNVYAAGSFTDSAGHAFVARLNP